MSESIQEFREEDVDLEALVENIADDSLFIVTYDIASQLKPLIEEIRPNSNLEIKIVSTVEEVTSILDEEGEVEYPEGEKVGDLVFLFSDEYEELKTLVFDVEGVEELHFDN